MYVFHYFIPFVSGLVIGSFLNCVIYRLEKEESFLKGRSYCPNCKHILNWQDLIPVVSFLWLKGQCRYCQKPISWQYPMVELATGLMFLLIFLASRDLAQPDNFLLFNTVYLWVLTSLLIVIFVYDLRHYIIPDSIVYPGIIIAVLYRLFGIWNFGNWDICLLAQFWCGGEFWVYDLGFSILPAFVLLAIILFSGGRWMGMGDFKLAILMGLILGWPNILFALFSAFSLCAIIGLGLIATKKKGLKSEIPFGPFLITGTFLALFWGQSAIDWYLGLIL